MIVVDAGLLFDALVDGRDALRLDARVGDLVPVAPHLVDVEVLGVIRKERMLGRLDRTEADRAVRELESWPGERFGHQPLLTRAWQLRDNVRSWDAMYVALAELLDVPLLTKDRRLAGATGPRCPIEVL